MKPFTLLTAVSFVIVIAPLSAASEKRDQGKQFIVASKVQDQPGPPTGCQIFAADAMIAAIYTKVYGPASREDCEKWRKKNCKGEKPDRSR